MALAQVNHKPVFVSRVPTTVVKITHFPITLLVRAYDPDGDLLTFTWKLNGHLAQASLDSTYVLQSTYQGLPAKTVTCVFSDPQGLADSTIWANIGGDLYVEPTVLPVNPFLYQNFPNPFNPSTTIAYYLTSKTHVTVAIYNYLGSVEVFLIDEPQPAGYHELRWSPALPSGAYFCKFSAGDDVQVRKLLLLK
jgi:hypothetical protein